MRVSLSHKMVDHYYVDLLEQENNFTQNVTISIA